MEKAIVKFTVDEGRPPTRSTEVGNPYVLRAPFAVYMEPNGQRVLSLGISCNLPSILVYKDAAFLVAPGSKYKVVLSSDKTALNIGEGEVLARVFPISSADIDLEGSDSKPAEKK